MILMQDTCSTCGTPFVVTEREQKLYAMLDVPPPHDCFWCCQRHRISFRNARKLYRRKCDFTGEEIISMYAQDKPYTVYKADIWYSDKWDPLSYGYAFDFSRPFFEQFEELLLRVPRLALMNINPTNSPYCNVCEGNKNCYLVFGGDFNEDSLYISLGLHNRNVMDCDFSNENEQCYDMCDSNNCYGCRVTYDSKNCVNCAFVSDCVSCTECILCTNLTHQNYYIRNQGLSREEYLNQKTLLLNGTFSQHQRNWKEFLKLRGERIVKSTHSVSSQDCVGDYLVQSKNCLNCFSAWRCEDLTDVLLAYKAKDCVNCGFNGDDTELCYNLQTSVGAYQCTHSFGVFQSKFVDYSESIFNSQYIFGCTNLNKYQYCILNRQYTEEEFNTLRKKIINFMNATGEWGQFFPRRLSCFGYNESTACDFFPLSREDALAQEFLWRDNPEEEPAVKKIVPAAELPDCIENISDEILDWAITCEVSSRPFKIIRQELEFYRLHRIPLPHLHPDERYLQRLAMRNSYRLWNRQCQKCKKGIQTTYSPQRPEKVYCEQCYLNEVY